MSPYLCLPCKSSGEGKNQQRRQESKRSSEWKESHLGVKKANRRKYIKEEGMLSAVKCCFWLREKRLWGITSESFTTSAWVGTIQISEIWGRLGRDRLKTVAQTTLSKVFCLKKGAREIGWLLDAGKIKRNSYFLMTRIIAGCFAHSVCKYKMRHWWWRREKRLLVFLNHMRRSECEHK